MRLFSRSLVDCLYRSIHFVCMAWDSISMISHIYNVFDWPDLDWIGVIDRYINTLECAVVDRVIESIIYRL